MSSAVDDKVNTLSFGLDASFRTLIDSDRINNIVASQDDINLSNRITALLNAISTIHSDIKLSPQTLKSIRKSLYLTSKSVHFAGTTSTLDSEPIIESLQWYLVGRLAILTYSNLLSHILNSTFPISNDLLYWRQTSLSPTYFAIQTLPHRLYRLLTHSIQFVLQQPSPRFQFKTPRLSLNLQRHRRVHPSFRFSTLSNYFDPESEIIEAHENLKSVKKAQAVLLGALFQEGYILGRHDGTHVHIEVGLDTIKKRLCELVLVMEKVLAKHTELSRLTGASINMSDLKDETPSILAPPKLSSTLLEILAQLTTTPTSIPVTTQTTTRILIRYGRPSFLTRYWIPFAVSFVSGYIFINTIQLNREKMIQWSEDFTETVVNGFKEWIWKPILEVWETVRHKESRIAVVGRESLNSDLESLERMVLNYVNAHKTLRTLSPEEVNSILYQTRQGDIGVVMREYESEVLHPLSSTITGHLPTLLLIQIQKTKVDLALALSALDKLLRSNELNFSVLAVLPVLILLGGGISWFRRLIRQWSGKGREKGLKKVRSVLIEVEKLVNRGRAMIGEEVEEGDKSRNKEQETMKEEELGLLLIELHYLRSLLSPSSPNSALSLSKTEVEQHLDDIRELESTSYTVEMKLRVVDRIWRSWDL